MPVAPVMIVFMSPSRFSWHNFGGPRRHRWVRCVILEAAKLLCDPRAHDLRQPQRTGPGIVPVGEHQIKLRPALATLTQRQGIEQTAFQFLAHRLLWEPGESQAHDSSMNRGRLVAHRPALFRTQPAAAAALAAGIANDEVAVLAQIL